jgi:prepilin-type N-terminal cleavage/methylation domain-containing protein
MFEKAKSENGFGLVEVLMSLAILGIIAVTFLMAIGIASSSILIANERTMAESLARTQMESIKEQEYNNANDGINDDDYDGAKYYKIVIDTSVYPDSFSICSENRMGEIVDDIIGVPWDSSLGEGGDYILTDAGLQRIKLIIMSNGEEVLSLEGYKVIRY